MDQQVFHTFVFSTGNHRSETKCLGQNYQKQWQNTLLFSLRFKHFQLTKLLELKHWNKTGTCYYSSQQRWKWLETSLTAAPRSLWNLLCLHTHTVVLATVIAAVFSSPELTNCCTNGSKSTTKDHVRAWNEMHKHSRRKMNLNCWKCQPCTVHLGEDVLRSSRMVCVCAAMSLHEL